MAWPALADGPAADVEAFMKEYVRLWNAGDAAAITTRVYKFDQADNPMQTKAGFDASYARLKGQGYDRSETKSVHACLMTPTTALAEMRYSRLKKDGTPITGGANLATLYLVRKTADGWRIAQMIGMDDSVKWSCESYKAH